MNFKRSLSHFLSGIRICTVGKVENECTKYFGQLRERNYFKLSLHLNDSQRKVIADKQNFELENCSTRISEKKRSKVIFHVQNRLSFLTLT